MSQISVIAKLVSKKDQIEKIKKELLNLVSVSKKDEGCIDYILHQSPTDKTNFFFYENWASKQSLDNHLTTDHIKRFFEECSEFLDQPVELNILERLTL